MFSVKRVIRRIVLDGSTYETIIRCARRKIFLLPLQSWIYRFAFQGQYCENTFMDASQGFQPDEPLQSFYAQREFPQGQRAFCPDCPGA
jgi:hypothetical protein